MIDRLHEVHTRLRDAYWNTKNLDAVIEIAREAERLAGADTSPEVLALLKAVAYDVGSFTWPGWAEPGVSVEPRHLAAGLEAARWNLELGRRLNRPELPMARAHWLVGAHKWVDGDRAGAQLEFQAAEQLARAAREVGEALLFRAYAEVVSSGAASSATLDELAGAKEGPELIAQLKTAVDTLSP